MSGLGLLNPDKEEGSDISGLWAGHVRPDYLEFD
jgi:hypothetical protein